VTAADDFRTSAENQWCPGCPNFGILAALRTALAELGKEPDNLCLVSGIGQAAKLPHYLKAHFYNGLHGRALPVATAVKAANPDLTVLVTTGDGDCYGEGGNHFLHAVRRNPDLTLIVHNNQIYGLTKGQASPTTDLGDRTRLQFDGVESVPFQPLAVALVNGCGFIARGYAGDIPHLEGLIRQAVLHRGFSLVDVVQPCITWGTHPVEWYKERVVALPADYDASDRHAALGHIMEWKDRIPVGILYRDPSPRACFGDRFRERVWKGRLGALGFPPPDRVAEMLKRFRM
jgi:2-oxoglutarate ferredoxin oxidoreductase subunit beta